MRYVWVVENIFNWFMNLIAISIQFMFLFWQFTFCSRLRGCQKRERERESERAIKTDLSLIIHIGSKISSLGLRSYEPEPKHGSKT